jgi:hypothetical protein
MQSEALFKLITRDRTRLSALIQERSRPFILFRIRTRRQFGIMPGAVQDRALADLICTCH